MIQLSPVALKYAKALFQVSKDHEKSLNQIRIISKIINADKTTIDFFKSDLISDTHKFEVVKKAFDNMGLSSESMNLVLILGEKGRLSLISDVLKAFESLVDQENGVTRGEVKSASVLGSEERKRIESVVSKVTHKKVILSYTEDAHLVGGVVAQVGGWSIEDSVDSHLTRLKEDLNRRAN